MLSHSLTVDFVIYKKAEIALLLLRFCPSVKQVLCDKIRWIILASWEPNFVVLCLGV